MFDFGVFKIPEYIDWRLFGPFLFLVVANLLYGAITISLKVEKKPLFRIIGEVLVLLLIAFFVYMANAHTENYDYDSYAYMYNHVDYYQNYKDFGYVKLMKFFISKGCDYVSFRTWVFLIFYLVIYISLWFMKANKNITFSLYAIVPWCYHLDQIRTFVGFSLIVFASVFLLLKGKWKIIGIPLFCIVTYCAYTVHGSMILYGIFILAFFTFKNKNYPVLIVFIVSITLILLYFNGYRITDSDLFNLLMEKFPLEELYSSHTPNYREYIFLLLIMLLQIASCCFSYLAFRGFTLKDTTFITQIDSQESKQKNKDRPAIQAMLCMAICMLGVMVLVTMNTFLVRMERNFFLITFAMLSIAMRNAKHKALNPFIIASFACAVLGIVVLFNFSNYWQVGGLEKIFWVFFE